MTSSLLPLTALYKHYFISRTHKVDKIEIIVILHFYLWFSSLLAPINVRTCENRNHEVYKNHTPKLIFLLDQLIGRAETTLSMLSLVARQSYLCSWRMVFGWLFWKVEGSSAHTHESHAAHMWQITCTVITTIWCRGALTCGSCAG